MAEAAEKIAGPNLDAKTWMEQFQQILGALSSEKVVTALTIGLIQLVAALNILITLIMMVMEKNRDIAVLMSMGAKHRQIRKIFMLEGVLIGVVGTAIGLTLGYTLSYLADRYHWLRLNAEVYSLPYVPFNARWQDGHLDRRRGHFHQLHCDALSGQECDQNRAGGSSPLRIASTLNT